MKVIFREAEFKDIEDIIKLCDEVFEEKTDLNYAKKVFLDSVNDDNQIYLVGEMDNKIVAHMKITIIPTMYNPMATYAMFNHVCVKKEYRRHNLATKMLRKAEDICKKKKCVKLTLWSNNFRVAAHACYKRFGFKIADASFFEKKLK